MIPVEVRFHRRWYDSTVRAVYQLERRTPSGEGYIFRKVSSDTDAWSLTWTTTKDVLNNMVNGTGVYDGEVDWVDDFTEVPDGL